MLSSSSSIFDNFKEGVGPLCETVSVSNDPVSYLSPSPPPRQFITGRLERLKSTQMDDTS